MKKSGLENNSGVNNKEKPTQSKGSLVCTSPRPPSKSQITVIEVGGFHSTMLPVVKAGEFIGGAAYVADAVTHIRQQVDPVLISNGDVFTGQTSKLEGGGDYVMQFMNELSFDAMTLGIHDFDEGQEVLAACINKANFAILAANLLCAKTGLPVSQCGHILRQVRPYALFNRGMQTVAVVGFMKENTPTFQSPRNIHGLRFERPQDAPRRWLPKLVAASPNVIVVQYNEMEEARGLARIINETMASGKPAGSPLPLLLFIGGHRDEKPIHEGNLVLMQGTDRGYRLGVINIKKLWKSTRVEAVYRTISRKTCLPDPVIAPLVGAIGRMISERDVVLGYTKETLQRHRFHDCSLGILVTEAMVKQAGAEIAFLSSGTLKLDMPAGKILASHLDDSVPFKDSIVRMALIGRKVQDILEQSAKLESDSGGSGGKILQVAGIRFRYSLKRPKGSRILSASILQAPIDPTRVYIAAVSKYLAEGCDGYPQFQEGRILRDCGDLKAAVRSYIKSLGTVCITRDFRVDLVEE